jgi:hypothetical protein
MLITGLSQPELRQVVQGLPTVCRAICMKLEVSLHRSVRHTSPFFARFGAKKYFRFASGKAET